MQAPCFISYSTAESSGFALRLRDALMGGPSPTQVWVDQHDIPAGSDWDDSIREAVSRCRALIFVMSPNSLQSEICKSEWTRALRNNKPVIPIVHKSFDEDLLPLHMEYRQRIDFTNPNDFEASLAKLRNHLRWLDTPAGLLESLKQRRSDTGHALRRARSDEERLQIQQDLDEINQQIDELQVVDHPEEASLIAGESGDTGQGLREPEQPDSGRHTSRLPAGATRTKLIGRSRELRKLTNALKGDTHVLSLVAWGGTGKSALAAHWMARLAKRNWDGIERYFDWSFYSQGTKGEQGTSADLFIAEALKHFGDPDPQAGSPHDRGDRLARLAAEQPTLLILDGLEPMQFGPGPQEGHVKDPALKSLLKGIAQRPFRGLLLITTREPVKDLVPFQGNTAVELLLENLSESAGAELLHHLGIKRAGAKSPISPDDRELHDAVSEVNGHALTLQLMSTYLARTQGGDILRRDRFRFEKAMKTTSDEHAFHVIAAYERWLSGQLDDPDAPQPRPEGERMLSVLRMLGLFDRPAPPGCLNDLRKEPVIEGLNEAVVHASDDEWNSALTHLQDLGLITLVGAEASSTGLPSDLVVDAHPLIREFFARQLRTGGRASGQYDGLPRPSDENVEGSSTALEGHRTGDPATPASAWTEGHRRVFEYLCKSTEHHPDGVDGLAPLYQAIPHGCHAGLHEQACAGVYSDRILRGNDFYSVHQLGAIGANLGAAACFFEQPWSRLSPNLALAFQPSLLNEAAYYLRALGRLPEAVEPMRAALEMSIDQEVWRSAAIVAGNLSELELTLGDVSTAISDGERIIDYAERSGEWGLHWSYRSRYADARHQAGERDEARQLFTELETRQARERPQHPLLYSTPGFRYCELLLFRVERAAWRVTLSRTGFQPSGDDAPGPEDHVADCNHVIERANEALAIAEQNHVLLSIGLDNLTLARAALYRWLTDPPRPQDSNAAALDATGEHLTAAVDGLRDSGELDLLPHGLLTWAWWRQVNGDVSGAIEDLDEAWEIAERGSMKLHQTDVLLTRARLGLLPDGLKNEEGAYPWGSPREDLDRAAKLIQTCGYHRRDEELADAQTALACYEQQQD